LHLCLISRLIHTSIGSVRFLTVLLTAQLTGSLMTSLSTVKVGQG
jgi:hypothetical protein